MSTKSPGKLYVITHDGSIPAEPFPSFDITAAQKAVGGYVRLIKVLFLGKVRDGYVNEDGLSQNLPINPEAQKLYAGAHSGVETLLVGNLAIWVPDGKRTAADGVGLVSQSLAREPGVQAIKTDFAATEARVAAHLNTLEAQTARDARRNAVKVPAKYRKDESSRTGYIDGATEPRALDVIAREISRDWKPVDYAAKPYLDALYGLHSLNESYGADSAQNVVRYFLANASKWRGGVAKYIKAELQALLDTKERS